VKRRQSIFAAIEKSRVLKASTKRSIVGKLGIARDFGIATKNDSVTQASTLANAILASDFSRNMESWLTKMFNEGVPSIYDKSADAIYNATHIGGPQLHRLFDESHTIWGLWDKVREASPDDSHLQEIFGYLTAYGKDLSSHVGMPLFGMSKDAYQEVSNTLGDTFNIPKPWVQDLFHVNGLEVFGTSIAAIALTLRWNKATTEEFSRLVGSLGVSSVISANPLLGIVTIATAAKAFRQSRDKDEREEAAEGLAKGGVGTGVILATAAVVPGPVWVGLVAGLCVGVVVNQATSKVQARDISAFVEDTIRLKFLAPSEL